MSQTIFPMIGYEDASGAMDWLVRAFGFREHRHLTDKEGHVVHGELELSGSIVMLASPTPAYQSPKRHAESCEQARRWLEVPWVIDGILVYVDDVDAHFKKAQLEGATLLSEIETGGPGRLYRYRPERECLESIICTGACLANWRNCAISSTFSGVLGSGAILFVI